jgi:hypothetical protein
MEKREPGVEYCNRLSILNDSKEKVVTHTLFYYFKLSDKSDIDILIDFEPDLENYDNYMAACDIFEEGSGSRIHSILIIKE